MTDGRSNFNFQKSEDQPPQEASQSADLDESKLVGVNISLSWEPFGVKQGTKTVREYKEEFLEKVKILGREHNEEELAWMFQSGLREELHEGVRAANCGWILNYVSDVADEAEKVEAKLRSTKEKAPLVSEEFADADSGHSGWGQHASEEEVESKPSKHYDSEDNVRQDRGD